MNYHHRKFLESVEKKAFEQRPGDGFKSEIRLHNDDFPVKAPFSDSELAGRKAANIRYRVFEKYDFYLAEFEKNFLARRGKIIWASSEKDVHREVQKILKHAEEKVIIRQRSFIAEETGIDETLKRAKREVYLTEIADFISTLHEDLTFFGYAPAFQASGERVNSLLTEKLQEKPGDETVEIVTALRKNFREKFEKAGVAVSGANFLLADQGAVVISENEGNAMAGSAFPRIQIILAGIDKIIPSVKDLDIFLPLLASHSTGQTLLNYNTILYGPGTSGEPDGPEEMFLVLVDNGRTEILGKPERRKALYCIHCGACQQHCPVYRITGDRSDETNYMGPIGAVTSLFIPGNKDSGYLSFASTLCGKCSEVCPVRIALTDLLLLNRQDLARDEHIPKKIRKLAKRWRYFMRRRWALDRAGTRLKRLIMGGSLKKEWGKRKQFPLLASRSFRELWLASRNED
jgi:L-lactate dehydrogenase complex protein LldF